MAFHINVIRLADESFFRTAPDVDSEAFDRWSEECDARSLHDNPLGADGTVYQFWSAPAQELRLPLAGAIYDDGLEVHGSQLAELECELDVLEAFWNRMDLAAEKPLRYVTVGPRGGVQVVRWVPLAEHLQERLGCLREAIRIAQECDGIVGIS